MKPANVNFLIDAIAFAGFMVLTTTGVLMRYILPPGSGHRSTIWGLDRHEWGGIHFWISLVFFSILALHLVLHWRWVVCVVTGKQAEGSGYRAGLGVVGLIATIALAVSPLVTPVEKEDANQKDSFLSSHEYAGIDVRGSMTLKEAGETNGVPAAYIIKSLDLPETTSENERIGSLRKQHGFEINDIREVISRYRNRK